MSTKMNSMDWPPVPGYELKENIGTGGFGLVFLAEERSLLRKKRAIKICWPSPLQSTEGVQERFFRESKTLSELSHPNIVSYVNSGFTEEIPPKPFVVMDFIEGDNLLSYSVETVEKACLITLSLLETLEYCHSKNVIHRDIKPSNVIIRPSVEAPVLVDFGLSINLESLSERISKDAPGSPGYMAPELLENPLLVDTRLDVYSMGVLLYELISGRRPDPLMPKPLADFKADADVYLDEIVRACLKDFNHRIASVKVFRDRLSNWLEVHRQYIYRIERLSPRGQALRKGFLEVRQRSQKNQESSIKHEAEMKKLATQQSDALVRQTLLLFEEAVDSLKEDLPAVTLEDGKNIHSTLASSIIAEKANLNEILDLITMASPGRKLSFSALKFENLTHPWTGEMLFALGKSKSAGVTSIHRGGIPSSRVMQPLFMVRSRIQNDKGIESDWLHLAVLMVFDDSGLVEASALKFLAEPHPKFTKVENRLVTSSSVEEVQNEIWNVIEWFVTTELVVAH